MLPPVGFPQVDVPRAKAAPHAEWSRKSDAAIAQAIARYDLERVGWRGFEAQPWVGVLKRRYPAVDRIAHTCSSHDNRYQGEFRDLLDEVAPADHAALKSFFIGKLALEELSCRRSGAAAGLCDKRAAYLQIFEMLPR